MIETYIQPFLNEWLEFFTNPQKRVYWLYLLTACLIGFAYLFYINKSAKKAIGKLFSKDNWWSKTAKADYQVLIFNSIIMLFVPKLLTKSVVAFGLFYTLTDWIPKSAMFQGIFEDWVVATMFTATLFIVDDFAKYWIHRWLHTIPFLWPYHRVHHSSTALNFFTIFRTHPIEGVLFSIRTAIAQGFVLGIFFFFFADQVSLMMLLGANVFFFAFNILGSNLRHSPVAMPYPKWLERYLMSPAQHHIHHSKAPEHKDKNFGIVFACWDRWFGGFCYSESNKELDYGVGNDYGDKEHTLKMLYLTPFKDSYKFLIQSFKKKS